MSDSGLQANCVPLRSRVLLCSALLLASLASAGPAVPAQQKASSTNEFERIAAEAGRARDANNLDKALSLYRKALGVRPSWAEGWWSLGTILYERDTYAEAARAFERVVALQPRHGSARVMLGLCEFELGQDSNALRDIQAGKALGILKNPELRRVMLYHEGILLLRKERFEAAQEVLDDLRRDGEASPSLILALGMSALRVRPDRLPPEGTTLREIVMRAGQAESLAAAKQFDAARSEYRRLEDEFPETNNVHYAYGRFLLEIHEVDAAVAEFQREIQRYPQHVLARLQIAAVRYRVDSADGVKYAEEAVQLDPRRPFGHYLLGLLYVDTQNFSGAISELETAKRSLPELPEIYFALGNAYARAGRKQEAAQARAVFKRLSARRESESTETVYGQRHAGLTERQLDPALNPKRPE